MGGMSEMMDMGMGMGMEMGMEDMMGTGDFGGMGGSGTTPDPAENRYVNVALEPITGADLGQP